jgi:uncharacterized protein DUF2795
MMDPSTAAELKTLLTGVRLPAGKAELLEHAVGRRAEPQFLDALQSLPEREYASLDEVVDELLHVQPAPLEAKPHPREESGPPPGGDAYTDPEPDTGRVRDLDQAEGS